MKAKKDLKIKICGLTRIEDAKLASDLGAWALGFIFFKESPRAITMERARELLLNLKGYGSLKVGVFVDEPLESLVKILESLRLDAVQLHGNESPSYCKNLKVKNPKLKIFKAFRLQRQDEVRRIKEFETCDQIVIDTFDDKTLGGTGRISRWDLALEAQKIRPVILAGGLNPENILIAEQAVNPFAFDLSSGVETSPGIKSHLKLKELFRRNE